ncbi:MAG TPA: phospholipase D-like domain-containing protein, partial [Nitrospiria bacterium]|nr:phospholipase D-like domain-containing protein [Nitrospiria bacterium]
MNEYPPGKSRWHSPAEPGSQAEKAFARASGASLIPGNALRLLRNAKENYPAWLSALESARDTIRFESYIFHNDQIGREFAEVLSRKAREGVRVRVIYDWFGSRGSTSRRFWKNLRISGVQVRCYNPPRWDEPFAWLKRDHRKVITVDGQVGFISGLCVSQKWRGDPSRGLEPWRDTGVEVKGPAVAFIDRAFEEIWAETGPPDPDQDRPVHEAARAGDVAVRIVAGSPGIAGLYRLDHLVATLAEKRLWLTDAYFVGVTPYVQALGAAARDGVDVRLLVPGSSDLPILSALSRAGYQPL